MSENKEEYLGDGLYASFDGFMFVLRAPRGVGGDHWVALEPLVLRRFNDYVQRMIKEKRDEASTT